MRVAVLVVACSFARAPTVDARPGKVVRIERRAHRFAGEPRLCSVMPDQLVAYCYGKAPDHGAVLTVLDQHRVLGDLVVVQSEPLGQCRGAQGTLWTVTLHNESGAELAPAATGVAGLLDVAVDPRGAKLVRAEAVPGDRPGAPEQVTAFDLDGDDRADLEFVAFTCDDAGHPISGVGDGAPDQCVELWVANGRNYERLRTDRIAHDCS